MIHSVVGMKRTSTVFVISSSTRVLVFYPAPYGTNSEEQKIKKMAELEIGNEKEIKKPNTEGDKVNIIVLMLLYTLQSAFSGLNTEAFPIILQKRKISYADQAQFGLSDYPFSFKILWAPIVDCVYSTRFGRRKTWLVPMQIAVGAMFLWISINADNLLGSEDGARQPRMGLLLGLFFVGMFFITLQDIALDGWSLTMLQRHNVGYASFCQAVGAVLGDFMCGVLIILLDSKDFCNKFRSIPRDYGFVSIANYLFFCSTAWLVSAVLILVFKKEDNAKVARTDDDDESLKLGAVGSYIYLWRILQIRPIIMIAVLCLTHRFTFAPIDSLGSLKMIEAGVSQDDVVLWKIPAIPIKIILSVVLRRSLTGPRSMRSFIIIYILRMMVGVVFTGILFLSSYMKDGNKGILPAWFYLVLPAVYSTSGIMKYLLGMSFYSFFCRVSDARYGGMYMTLALTMFNLGGSWTSTVALFGVDFLTVKTCIEDKEQMTVVCGTKFDGFYVESVLFTVLGATWLCWSKNVIHKLEKLSLSSWIVKEKKTPEDVKLPVNEENTRIL